ncbi:MAG: hypothetical protein KAR14_02430 [Candidatus Aminicenantes bacterium]|nr:hypothetical protein [Candidatus Aminicenantes bacterium]
MKRLLIIFFLIPLFLIPATEFSIERAKRIDGYLKRISARKTESVILKNITFSQRDLNSYLNLIYTRKYAREVKYIKLELGKNNYIGGNMKIVLKGEKYAKIPSFLKDFEIDFEGKVFCSNYRMRYDFEKVRINGTSFSPEILDEAFGAAQTGYKIKKSMFDWFRLLPGIKNIKTDHKKLIIFY